MNKHNFIKLTADNDGELVNITLNTSNIDSYVEDTSNGNETNCRISISSHKDAGCDFLWVIESKFYLDMILTSN